VHVQQRRAVRDKRRIPCRAQPVGVSHSGRGESKTDGEGSVVDVNSPQCPETPSADANTLSPADTPEPADITTADDDRDGQPA
jgi:hypothetical protein